MAIAEDLAILDSELKELITRYDQYFIGLEKREPYHLLKSVEKMVRRYNGVPINNTMYKHKYNMLVARLNTYREQWNRILRLIDEGKYSRDKFISNLHQRQRENGTKPAEETHRPQHHRDPEVERIFIELREARKACNMPVDKLDIETVEHTLEKNRAALAAKLGTSRLVFRVVIENGKPKIKASQAR